ncbi:ATP-binding protein [Actinoallomurus soli]|uniref:ATP-binding protein n=1 Tax=Actinoallomurus soli TaxID=2952535 RepID=UPI0038738949
MTQWRCPSADREPAELIVGELAANAAEHGRHDMTVRLSRREGVLWISVTDSGVPARPRRTRSRTLHRRTAGPGGPGTPGSTRPTRGRGAQRDHP